MCNAWNHPIGCTCGWGGDGHLGKGGGAGSYFAWDNNIYRKHFTSYVTPNATCPVCGVPVFFYQSQHGGRVFFDDLGPPWPKHPCTDNNPKEEYGLNLLLLNKKTNKPRWVKEGWLPACLIKIGHRTNRKLVCFRIFEKRNKRIVQTLMTNEIEQLRKEGVLIFYRNIDKQNFQLSVYDFDKEEEGIISLNYFGKSGWR